MAQVASVYNHTFDLIGAGTVKEGDTFKMALMTSSHTFTATHTLWSQVSANEVSAGNGYTAGGITLTNFVIFNGAPGTPWIIDWDNAAPGWTASGGSIGPYRFLLIYDDTVVSPADAVLFSIDLDNTPNTFTAADGADINVNVPAGGFISLAAA